MKKKLWTFVVQRANHSVGFRFPMDMLRYDSCHPTHPSDVNLIGFDESGRAPILLTSYVGEPTKDRWKSFGWEVISVTEVRI